MFLAMLLDFMHSAVGGEISGALNDVWEYTASYLLTVWQNRLYVYTTSAVLIGIWFTVNMAFKKKKNIKIISPWLHRSLEKQELSPETEKVIHVAGVRVFYGSQTGTAKEFAKELAEDVRAQGLQCEVIDMKEYDPDDRLAEECTSKMICVFLVATYTDGQPTENAEWFCKWLEEASTDFRYGKTYLKGMRYAVFGLGNSVYIGHYNTVSKNLDKWLWMLSAARIMTRGEGDCNVVKSRHGSVQADFQAWKTKFLSRLQALVKGEKKACSGKCKNGSCKNKKKHKEEAEDNLSLAEKSNSEEELMESSSDAESSAEEDKSHGSVIDMEDLGNVMNRLKKAKRMEDDKDDSQRVKLSKQNGVRKSEAEEERREMITPALRDALTKQGYKLIGSHSGVKLCRWTKSMLRGRGGCYKHTFYGIESHRCMETTPSLACANKCVFCWRHHTNPVGTEWHWKMDPAEKILQEAVENHRNMIRQFRGVPGVRPERFEEGLRVKHCALSLVGEPIMYPEINSFLRLLHQQHISSFLVTNAQFPDEIRSLVPVTQLYVSVDASTKDSLKKIDRPLFKDFWQRFLDSMRALGEKQQRTVYRLTLVKAWNVDELKAYSDLIALGQPDFIEVKGVTYCGDSSASSLTMANVPWHEEVIYFVQQLANLLPDYEIACEHEHSNCLLLAHHKFKVNGEWWTWIDYECFQELIQEYEESGGTKNFSAMDYMAKTPSWAIFGARERGFDPSDTRFQRKNKTKDISGC
ncbi:S-adenosyl-L-methionine-dependent tRNA 4-demethylwyosine synthase TYW1 isoform X1 [Myxocyprinus asiaticus]|uniref:S-adenosyl-L-methionine-dependent tRNA 4-demethylwyosine synthase TYW1 isoform X1 n=1 Tax=Myxocyprinus asiaticus TaxID=70543 RepID=UPI002221F63F|nr:S-adenosyl-L-methionine-dependent tRNA 4-demethylwyosine synthase TYW1 isoform X1 [Myxocyprinus asiaticus]